MQQNYPNKAMKPDMATNKAGNVEVINELEKAKKLLFSFYIEGKDKPSRYVEACSQEEAEELFNK